ncbi:hypothetical protein [Mucilaginibacter sp. CSA2-8R]|uniref:hypothetical protein n=1 Tax=Mucilaginibacter sp. CSA2-8R TaxID=3141542 RepID=UPI00315DEE9D
MNALIAPIMAIIFLGWVIYLAFTRTLKRHRDEVFAGFFFMAVWVVILVVVS